MLSYLHLSPFVVLLFFTIWNTQNEVVVMDINVVSVTTPMMTNFIDMIKFLFEKVEVVIYLNGKTMPSI
jgi:hypothetical protein